MPRRKRYPWINHYIDRNGRSRIYFRKPGFPRIPLPVPYGGPEFLVAYYAALAGKPDKRGAANLFTLAQKANMMSASGMDRQSRRTA
jgi:hypothetical protein